MAQRVLRRFAAMGAVDTPGQLQTLLNQSLVPCTMLASFALLGTRYGPRKVGGACTTGQEKGAKFPTSKAHISVVFHSFWLIFRRVIISRNGLERERLSLERARAERPR